MNDRGGYVVQCAQKKKEEEEEEGGTRARAAGGRRSGGKCDLQLLQHDTSPAGVIQRVFCQH